MAVADPKVWPRESSRELAIEIEKCIQLYMDRDETAHAVEIHTGVDGQTTQMVWDRLAELNLEFFGHYYIRVALIRQIVRFNQLLEQQHRAMNFLTVPAEQRTSMGMTETAPQDDSPASVMSQENDAESDKQPAIPDGFVRSEELAGTPHLMAGSSLARSSSEAQGMRINAALVASQMPILQVPNHITGDGHSASFGGPFQSSTSTTERSSHLDSNHNDTAPQAASPGARRAMRMSGDHTANSMEPD